MWGAASLTAHLVFMVLSGISQIHRSVHGADARSVPVPDLPVAVLPRTSPPDFATGEMLVVPPAIPPPPLEEFVWWREEGHGRGCGPADESFRTMNAVDPLWEGEPLRGRGSALLRIALPGTRTAGGRPERGAILAALRWLARHQSADGTWKVQSDTERCRRECLPNSGLDDFEVGVTGLALLAFSRAGYTGRSPDVHDGIPFGQVVRGAVTALVARQDPAGCIGSRPAAKYMYNHVFGTLALAEAARSSHLFREEVRKAVDFLLASQNPGMGWRYSRLCGDNDSVVTGWAVQALLASEPLFDTSNAKAYAAAFAWLDEVTCESYGRVGYVFKDSSRKLIPSWLDRFDYHETPTALVTAARLRHQGADSPPHVRRSLDLISRDLPKWDDTSIDFHYWHTGTLALKAATDPLGERWEAWNQATTRAVLPNQHAQPDACRDGSWEPADRWSNDGGRVYATAINALTLLLLSR